MPRCNHLACSPPLASPSANAPLLKTSSRASSCKKGRGSMLCPNSPGPSCGNTLPNRFCRITGNTASQDLCLRFRLATYRNGHATATHRGERRDVSSRRPVVGTTSWSSGWPRCFTTLYIRKRTVPNAGCCRSYAELQILNYTGKWPACLLFY